MISTSTLYIKILKKNISKTKTFKGKKKTPTHMQSILYNYAIYYNEDRK